MRVRFKTISAGPRGAIFPGDLLDVSESEAKMLVNAGYAEYVTPPVNKTTVEDTAETTEVRQATRRHKARSDPDGI